MSLTEIVSNLESLLVEIDGLLATSRDKQTAIIRNEIDEINRLTHKESKSAKAIGQLEQERQRLTAQWAEQSGMSTARGQLTLQQIERSVVSAAAKSELGGLRERLVRVTNELHAQNDHNQRLLQQSLLYTNFSLDIMTGGFEEEMIYRPPEQPSHTRKHSLFDRKS